MLSDKATVIYETLPLPSDLVVRLLEDIIKVYKKKDPKRLPIPRVSSPSRGSPWKPLPTMTDNSRLRTRLIFSPGMSFFGHEAGGPTKLANKRRDGGPSLA